MDNKPMTTDDLASTLEHCAGLLGKAFDRIMANGVVQVRDILPQHLAAAQEQPVVHHVPMPDERAAMILGGVYGAKQLLLDADMLMHNWLGKE